MDQSAYIVGHPLWMDSIIAEEGARRDEFVEEQEKREFEEIPLVYTELDVF